MSARAATRWGGSSRSAARSAEWELLIAMHRGYYPLSDFQAFRRGGPPQTEPGPDGRPPDNRHPMDKVIPKLAEQLALEHARVVGLVGQHADAEDCGPLGIFGLSGRARAVLRRDD